MVTGEIPWDCAFGSQIATRVAKGERPPLPEDPHFKEIIRKSWSGPPHLRPSFPQLFDDFSRLKIQFQQEDANQIEACEKQVLRAFANDDSLPWDKFVVVIQRVFSIGAPSIVEDVRFVLESDSVVYKSTWSEFIRWFSPLIALDNYHTLDRKEGDEFAPPLNTTAPMGIPDGYTFEEVVDIVKERFYIYYLVSLSAGSLASFPKVTQNKSCTRKEWDHISSDSARTIRDGTLCQFVTPLALDIGGSHLTKKESIL